MGKTTENPGEPFATQFYVWMKAAGYPHESAIANMAGVDPATLGRILKGERGMGPDVAKKLAGALHVNQVDFFRAYGLLDPEPGQRPDDPKQAIINRIMATIEELPDDDLTRLEFMVRGLAEGQRHQQTNTGGVGLGGTLTTKLIKGKAKPA